MGRRMAADVARFELNRLLDIGRSVGQGCRSEGEKFGSSAPHRSGTMGQTTDEIVRAAIDSWPGPIRRCIRKRGGRFEK